MKKMFFQASRAHQDEDPSLGSGRRLSDPVADLRDLVEGRVGSEAEVGARNVVADRRRENDDRDLELRILVPVLHEQEGRVEGLEPPEHQDAADLLLPDLLGHQVELPGRQGSLRSELGSSDGGPSVDGSPRQLEDLSFEETLESVGDTDRIVSAQNAVPYEGPG